MSEMIISTVNLPEQLFNMIRTPLMQVQETEKGIILIPVESNQSLDAIRKARGMYTDGKLTVDKFLAEKRAEETD
jgi:hypothetical protein